MILAALALSAATGPTPPRESAARDGYELVTPLGSRLPRWEERASPLEKNANVVLRRFAACVAKTQQPQAVSMVGTLPDSAEEVAAIKAIVGKYSECLQGAGQMRLRAALFKGAIAEALYKQQLPTPERLTKQPMVEYDVFERTLRDSDRDGVDAADASVHATWWMSYCAVHTDPLAVDRVVRSEPDTLEELEAIRAMRPTLAGCLFRNQTADFNRISLRSALASALYRMRFGFGEGSDMNPSESARSPAIAVSWRAQQ